MLKIQFDHQIFSMQRYGGISRYFANIQHRLKEQSELQFNNGIFYTSNYYLKDAGRFPYKLGRTLFKKEASVNRKYSARLISANEYDVLHPTYYDPYFIPITKKPFVITVHDMIHELFPEFFDPGDTFVKYKRLCIEKAAHIIAISETTKEDLKMLLGVEDNRITVIHHGFTPQLSANISHDSTQTRDYLLFVGDRRGYKNFARFAKAAAHILDKHPSIDLICAGGGPFQSAELEMFLRLKTGPRIYQINASDEELEKLYKNALAFIYPSLYEGFGLPILEAFQFNCPIIASNTPCFKEIAGEAIAYFNPLDEHDIFNAINNVINDETLANDLIIRGQHQLSKFTIDLCMDRTISVYKKIANIR